MVLHTQSNGEERSKMPKKEICAHGLWMTPWEKFQKENLSHLSTHQICNPSIQSYGQQKEETQDGCIALWQLGVGDW